MIEMSLQPLSPFRLGLTAWVLRRLPINLMDRWDNHAYSRTIVLDETPAELTVVQTGTALRPRLDVTIEGVRATRTNESVVRAMMERLLGLRIDLSGFYRAVRRDRYLADLAERFIGFKPPRFPTVFEALVNGVACQQLSLTVGITLLNRLCETYGRPRGRHHAFAQSADLVNASPEFLRQLGFSTRKAQYILDAAQAIEQGRLDLESLRDLDDASAVSQLRQLPGIGRWTAEYIALRGLGKIDVLPADDVGLQSKAHQWLGLTDRPDYEQVQRLLDRYQPYRGLVYFHLLLDGLDRRGVLQDRSAVVSDA